MAKTRFKNKNTATTVASQGLCTVGIHHTLLSRFFFFKADFAVVLFSRCKLSWRIQLSLTIVSDKV